MSYRCSKKPVSISMLLCAVMIGCVTAGAQPAQDNDETSLTVDTNLVNVAVTVVDASGRNVSGLGKNAFAIYDNKQRQEIAGFAVDDSPASIAVVFDLSGSMSQQKMAQAKHALRLFFENSHPQDEYSLIGFNGAPEVLVDSMRDAKAILQRLYFQPAHGQTALFDACRLAVATLEHGAYKRRAILIVSDGQDNDSRSSLGELRRQLSEEDVLTYAIGINDPARVGREVRLGRSNLDELTATTGGRAFFPFNQEEMIKASEQIALELRSQYLIAYRPEKFVGDGKWHEIKIALEQSEPGTRLHLRHRSGYYAELSHRDSNRAE